MIEKGHGIGRFFLSYQCLTRFRYHDRGNCRSWYWPAPIRTRLAIPCRRPYSRAAWGCL